MLVVADKSMVDFYEGNEHGGVEKYVLTIVNMVRSMLSCCKHVCVVRVHVLYVRFQVIYIYIYLCQWVEYLSFCAERHPGTSRRWLPDGRIEPATICAHVGARHVNLLD